MADSTKHPGKPPAAGRRWKGETEAGSRSADAVDGLFGPAPSPESDDPVASLFQSDQTLPGPQRLDEPSTGEGGGLWRANPSSSLFDNAVKDPPPDGAASAQSQGSEAQSPAPRAAAIGGAPTLLGIADPPKPPERALQPPPPARIVPEELSSPAIDLAPPSAVAAPPPARVVADEPLAPPARTKRGPRKSRKRKAVAAVDEDDAAAYERQRLRHKNAIKRRKNLTLAGLSALTAIVLAAVAMLLGVIPNPLSNDGVGRIERVAEAPSKAAEAKAEAQGKAKRKVQEPKQPAQAKAALAVPKEPEKTRSGIPAKAPVPAPDKPASAPAEASAKTAAQPPEATAAPQQARPARVKPSQADSEPDPETLDARRALLLGNRKLADDEAEVAERLARSVLAKDPRDHHAMELLARALVDQGRGNEAVKYARAAVARRKRRAKYRVLLGDALLMTGDKAGAHKEWQIALKLDPGDKAILRRLQ